MRPLRLHSDLHAEFYARPGQLWSKLNKSWDFSAGPTTEEILILAGDISWPVNRHGRISAAFRELLLDFKQRWNDIILVPGNHEYYAGRTAGLEPHDVDVLLRQFGQEVGVHVLQKASVVLDDMRFIGCTLWSDISTAAFYGMNDRLIPGNDYLSHLARHIEQREWLEGELAADTRPTVVVTHHLPSEQLVHPAYAGGDNTGYFTDLESVITRYQDRIKLWCCGHTHEQIRVAVAGVPIITNPLGYPQEYRRTKPLWGRVEI